MHNTNKGNKNMEIYNGTQHAVNIFAKEDTIEIQEGRKLIVKDGAKPVFVIPAGKNLNAQKENLPSPAFTVEGVPLKGAVVFQSCDPIPEEAKGKIIIVSQLYRSAAKELGIETTMLAVVDGPVYQDETCKQPCGVLGLAVG